MSNMTAPHMNAHFDHNDSAVLSPRRNGFPRVGRAVFIPNSKTNSTTTLSPRFAKTTTRRVVLPQIPSPTTFSSPHPRSPFTPRQTTPNLTNFGPHSPLLSPSHRSANLFDLPPIHIQYNPNNLHPTNIPHPTSAPSAHRSNLLCPPPPSMQQTPLHPSPLSPAAHEDIPLDDAMFLSAAAAGVSPASPLSAGGVSDFSFLSPFADGGNVRRQMAVDGAAATMGENDSDQGDRNAVSPIATETPTLEVAPPTSGDIARTLQPCATGAGACGKGDFTEEWVRRHPSPCRGSGECSDGARMTVDSPAPSHAASQACESTTVAAGDGNGDDVGCGKDADGSADKRLMSTEREARLPSRHEESEAKKILVSDSVHPRDVRQDMVLTGEEDSAPCSLSNGKSSGHHDALNCSSQITALRTCPYEQQLAQGGSSYVPHPRKKQGFLPMATSPTDDLHSVSSSPGHSLLHASASTPTPQLHQHRLILLLPHVPSAYGDWCCAPAPTATFHPPPSLHVPPAPDQPPLTLTTASPPPRTPTPDPLSRTSCEMHPFPTSNPTVDHSASYPYPQSPISAPHHYPPSPQPPPRSPISNPLHMLSGKYGHLGAPDSTAATGGPPRLPDAPVTERGLLLLAAASPPVPGVRVNPNALQPASLDVDHLPPHITHNQTVMHTPTCTPPSAFTTPPVSSDYALERHASPDPPPQPVTAVVSPPRRHNDTSCTADADTAAPLPSQHTSFPHASTSPTATTTTTKVTTTTTTTTTTTSNAQPRPPVPTQPSDTPSASPSRHLSAVIIENAEAPFDDEDDASAALDDDQLLYDTSGGGLTISKSRSEILRLAAFGRYSSACDPPLAPDAGAIAAAQEANPDVVPAPVDDDDFGADVCLTSDQVREIEATSAAPGVVQSLGCSSSLSDGANVVRGPMVNKAPPVETCEVSAEASSAFGIVTPSKGPLPPTTVVQAVPTSQTAISTVPRGRTESPEVSVLEKPVLSHGHGAASEAFPDAETSDVFVAGSPLGDREVEQLRGPGKGANVVKGPSPKGTPISKNSAIGARGGPRMLRKQAGKGHASALKSVASTDSTSSERSDATTANSSRSVDGREGTARRTRPQFQLQSRLPSRISSADREESSAQSPSKLRAFTGLRYSRTVSRSTVSNGESVGIAGRAQGGKRASVGASRAKPMARVSAPRRITLGPSGGGASGSGSARGTRQAATPGERDRGTGGKMDDSRKTARMSARRDIGSPSMIAAPPTRRSGNFSAGGAGPSSRRDVGSASPAVKRGGVAGKTRLSGGGMRPSTPVRTSGASTPVRRVAAVGEVAANRRGSVGKTAASGVRQVSGGGTTTVAVAGTSAGRVVLEDGGSSSVSVMEMVREDGEAVSTPVVQMRQKSFGVAVRGGEEEEVDVTPRPYGRQRSFAVVTAKDGGDVSSTPRMQGRQKSFAAEEGEASRGGDVLPEEDVAVGPGGAEANVEEDELEVPVETKGVSFAVMEDRPEVRAPRRSGRRVTVAPEVEILTGRRSMDSVRKVVMVEGGGGVQSGRASGDLSTVYGNRSKARRSSASATMRVVARMSGGGGMGRGKEVRRLSFRPERRAASMADAEGGLDEEDEAEQMALVAMEGGEQEGGRGASSSRARVTVPKPFSLSGEALQERSQLAIEEARRKKEEVEKRRRVFRARPMPDFSKPFPRPKPGSP